MTHVFSIKEVLKFGWHITRTHSALVFKVVLTLLAFEVARAIVEKVLEGTALGFVAAVVLYALITVLGIGATRITLHLVQGKPAHYRDIMPPTNLLWPYIGASILTGLAVLGGLILLIIPGIIVAIRLSMARFEVIEGAGIKESLHKSWELTRGHTWKLALFFGALVLLNIAGALMLLVGLLLTIPVSMIACADVYRKLKSKA